MAGMLSSSRCAVVAGGALARDNAGMVEMGWDPATSGVAEITGLSGLEVSRILSSGGNAIVTAGAGARLHIDVPEPGRCPGIGAMTLNTLPGGGYVGGRFTRCSGAVMTA